MKKLLLLVAISLFCGSLFSQVYKLEKVHSYFSHLNLSHWKSLENAEEEIPVIFSLWGEQKLHEYTYVEIEYFKGNANETYTFLKNVADFALKYKKEDIITTFSGIRIRTEKYMEKTLIFDKENKFYYKLSWKEWAKILEKFTTYCDTNNIKYQ